MSHPYRDHHAGKSPRARHLLKSSGGSCSSTSSPMSSAGLSMKRGSKGGRSEDSMMAAGGKTPKRYAKGGKTKHVTNIIIAHKPPAPPMAGAAPMAPPPAGPMGAPPPGMPMKPPGMKRGGRAGHHLDEYMRGGAATGVGREEKAEHQRGKR